MSRRIVSHEERIAIEKQVLADIGEALAPLAGFETDFGYSYDAEKGVLIVEKYSDLGNPVEFYEVRPVVSYIGQGSANKHE